MFSIRKAKAGDIEFIYATWLRSYKHDSPLTKYTKRELFFDQHQKILDTILSNDGVQTCIACDPEDEDLIFGYITFEPKIIHFIYVKYAFRKRGIATKLLEQILNIEQCEASHLTYSLLDLWTAGKIKIEFNPYLTKGTK